jgi:hypothetical protein
MFGVTFSLLPAIALAQIDDGCPDSGAAGSTTPIVRVFKSDNTCEVTEGKYIKKSLIYRVDFQSTASGICNTFSGYPECPPTGTYLRTLQASNIQAVFPTQYTYSLGVVQPIGQVQYYATFGGGQKGTDPVNTQTQSPQFFPYLVGQYTVKAFSNVSTTPCNLLPMTYDSNTITVQVVTGFHRGTTTNGSLAGGDKLGEGTGPGRYHYHGSDPVGYEDTWAVPEYLTQTIKDVGASWSQSYPNGPLMGTGDMSDFAGGQMDIHTQHQNGLDVDVRYVRTDLLQQGLDLSTQYSSYDKTKTIALLQTWANTGRVAKIYVGSEANISSSDITGAQIVVDSGGGHANHFHVELIDSDGVDSNNCY